MTKLEIRTPPILNYEDKIASIEPVKFGWIHPGDLFSFPFRSKDIFMKIDEVSYISLYTRNKFSVYVAVDELDVIMLDKALIFIDP